MAFTTTVGEFADLKYLATLGLHSTLTAAVAVQHHQVRSVSQFLSLKKFPSISLAITITTTK